MIHIRRAHERGHLVAGGMEAWESFSRDAPSWRNGFRLLALLDECTLAPRTHFSPHRHWDDEVISYLLQGSLTHTDSLGNTGAVRPGDVQIMSGGSGIFHEEWVPVEVGVTKLYQIMLIETVAPDRIADIQKTVPYGTLIEMLGSQAKDMHVVAMRDVKRIGDVDKTRQGLFLFNYFVADDVNVLLQVWEYTAGWFAVETGLDNSTLLQPLEGEHSDYVVINNARWDGMLELLPSLMFKKSFKDYLIAILEANRAGAMPILYRLA